MYRITLCLVSTLLLIPIVACGEPTIDGSTKADYDESLVEMSKSLNDEQRDQLTEAIMMILLDGHDFFEAAAIMDELGSIMRSKIDGMTFAEIVAMAQEIKNTEAREKIRALQDTLASVRERSASIPEVRKGLDGLRILSAEHFYREGKSHPTVTFTIRNDLEFPVSVIYIYSEISSPDSLWKSDTSTLTMGLRPLAVGEERKFSYEGHPEVPRDANDVEVSTVVVGVEGPGGDPPFTDGDPKIDTRVYNRYTRDFELDSENLIEAIRREISELEDSIAE